MGIAIGMQEWEDGPLFLFTRTEFLAAWSFEAFNPPGYGPHEYVANFSWPYPIIGSELRITMTGVNVLTEVTPPTVPGEGVNYGSSMLAGLENYTIEINEEGGCLLSSFAL